LLTAQTMVETPENHQLNQRCEQIRRKIREGPPVAIAGIAPATGPNGEDTLGLAVAAQTLTMVMTSNENTRIREREEDKGSKSLIRNLGPKQQSLFLRLATEHMKEEPEMSNFMKLVLSSLNESKRYFHPWMKVKDTFIQG
jgi:hypothetical protein